MNARILMPISVASRAASTQETHSQNGSAYGQERPTNSERPLAVALRRMTPCPQDASASRPNAMVDFPRPALLA